MCAKPGKAGDDLPQRQTLDGKLRLFRQFVKAVCRGVGTLTVGDVLGCWPDDQVAVYRGADQHALAELSRQLEHGMADMCACRTVQQHILAAPGRDVQLRFARQIVKRIGVHAGGVHHAARHNFAAVRLDMPEAVFPVQRGHLGIEPECNAVCIRVFRQRYGERKRADDAAGRGVERADGI